MLLPFIKDGLECGEKAVHTVDRQRRDEHIQRLASTGIDVAAARDGGQLELRTWAMQTCATWHPYEVSTVSLAPMAYIVVYMYVSFRGGARKDVSAKLVSPAIQADRMTTKR